MRQWGEVFDEGGERGVKGVIDRKKAERVVTMKVGLLVHSWCRCGIVCWYVPQQCTETVDHCGGVEDMCVCWGGGY